MPWILEKTVSVPIYLVKAQFLHSLGKMKITLTEIDSSHYHFRPIESLLFAKHPISFISRGEIYLKEMPDEKTEINLRLYPTALRVFVILFPLFFMLALNLLADFVTESGYFKTMEVLWMIHTSFLGGAILIYILIKQTVLSYFGRIVREAITLG